MKLTEFISDVGRPVAFYPGLRRITGSTTATLFLCQLIYWTGKQKDPDGWIYKESSEIEEETGLSYGEQATARKQLVRNGLIEEQYKRLDHKLAFRIVENTINEKWRNGESAFGEQANQEMGKDGIANSLIGNSESTAETTAKNTVVPPNVFQIYTSEIGALTPILKDALEDMEKEYPPEWFGPAVKEAKKSSPRISLKYVEGILKRWKTQGLPNELQPKKKQDPAYTGGIVLPDYGFGTL